MQKKMQKVWTTNDRLSRRYSLSMPILSLLMLSLIVLVSMAIEAAEFQAQYTPNIEDNTSTMSSVTLFKQGDFTQLKKRTLPRDFLNALQAVIIHNPALKGQQAALNSYEADIDSAKARRYPTLSAQANNLNNDADQGTLRLNQPLWAFGKIDTAIDEATANYTAEQWGLIQNQRELISDTAKIYAKIQGLSLIHI